MKLDDYSREFDYPEAVLDYSTKIVKALNEDNFFEDEEISPRIFFERLCETSLKTWLAGSIQLDEEQMIEVITTSAAETVLRNLKDKSLLDSIIDDGEEKFFLTAEGKMVADLLLGEQSKGEKK